MSNGRLRIEYLPLSKLKDTPGNPKTHALDQLAESFARFGFVVPILWDPETNQIVAGHGRAEGLRKAHAAGDDPPAHVEVGKKGEWLVPVVQGTDWDNQDEALAFLLADNEIARAGGHDDDKAAKLIAGMAKRSVPLTGIGYSKDVLARLTTKKGRQKNPNKYKARDAVNNAVRDGRLTREPCEVCGTTKRVEAHHDDYAKLLDVRWLCFTHHRQHHGQKTGQAKLNPDQLPDEPPNPTTKEGDLWELGPHRLYCGDANTAETLKAIMAGESAAMVFTDPPYAIYGSSTGIASDITDDKMVRPFFESILRQCFRVLPWFGHAYVCCDWRSWSAWWESCKASGLQPKNLIVWDKGGQGLGSNYANTHEFVGYFAKMPTQTAMGNQPAGQRAVFRPNLIHENRVQGKERQHNAQKPVDLVREFVRNGCDEGDIVVDFFGGSGTTIIAAEHEDRRCYMTEIRGVQCDKIVARWEGFTGGKAKRIPAEPTG